MAKIKSGITNRTINSFQLDAGVLLSSFDPETREISEANIIGATSGGGSVSITSTTHTISVDGAPEHTVGLTRKDGVEASLEFTMIEFTAEGIIKSLLGASMVEEDGWQKITAVRDIFREQDYHDAWWVGELSDGRQIVVWLKNALSSGEFSLSVSDKGEGTYSLSLTANYSYEDMYTDPFEIWIEDNTNTDTGDTGDGDGN